MKRAMNFRLSSRATTALLRLEKKTHESKTTIVERALQLYEKEEFLKKDDILEYAGILNEKDADKLLSLINNSKHNKDIETEL